MPKRQFKMKTMNHFAELKDLVKEVMKDPAAWAAGCEQIEQAQATIANAREIEVKLTAANNAIEANALRAKELEAREAQLAERQLIADERDKQLIGGENALKAAEAALEKRKTDLEIAEKAAANEWQLAKDARAAANEKARVAKIAEAAAKTALEKYDAALEGLKAARL